MSPDPVVTVRQASSLMKALAHLRDRFSTLTLTELTTLLAVAENQGVTVTGLADLCGYTIATASRTTRGLAAPDMPGALPPSRGLVTLRRGPHENRYRYVFLTPEGLELCREVDRILLDAPAVRIVEDDAVGLAA